MRRADFHFDLPEALIAQEPAPERDGSRLLAMSRAAGTIAHRAFRDLPGLLRKDDLLVFNDTRVIPARLIGKKPSGGRAELLLIEPLDDEKRRWKAMGQSSKRRSALALRCGSSNSRRPSTRRTGRASSPCR